NHLVDEWRQYAIAHDKALDELERGAASDPETILTMLHYIQEQYQSTEKYLLSCGMSIDTIAQLKSRFLE
ncbi:MAG: tyrosine-protein phosphatase, partial [Phototrophicaceae bacterium]